jgi:F-type H+-transporting ATPase subunit a
MITVSMLIYPPKFSFPILNFILSLINSISLNFPKELVKIISLSFRLFGNVFAGEVLMIIISYLAAYIIPLPFLFLEVFVGLIQAFIFATITLVSISLHTTVHEHEEAHT